MNCKMRLSRVESAFEVFARPVARCNSVLTSLNSLRTPRLQVHCQDNQAPLHHVLAESSKGHACELEDAVKAVGIRISIATTSQASSLLQICSHHT